MTKITAVIVARKESKRIPNKMHQKIGDETLVMRKVRQCIGIREVDKVFVIGDVEESQKEIENAGAIFCRQVDRYCRGDSKKVNEMVEDALSYFDSDYVLWAHPTNPFIDAKHYKSAIDIFKISRREGYDSLFSVSKINGHFWSEFGTPLNHNPMSPRHVIARALNPIFSQNGGIFIRKYKDMEKDGSFVGAKPKRYIMSQLDGWDIDYKWQLEFAQLYSKLLDSGKFLT